MGIRRSVCWSLSVGLILALGSTAWATMDNLKTYKAAYPGKPATCKTCHQGAVGKKGDLNAYGTALQTSKGGPGKALKLTTEDVKAVEKGDADHDGVSNGDEIAAGTPPGETAPGSKVK